MPRGSANSGEKMKRMHVTYSNVEAPPPCGGKGTRGGPGDIWGCPGMAQQQCGGTSRIRTSTVCSVCAGREGIAPPGAPRLRLGDPRWFNPQLFPLFSSPEFLDNR